MSVIVTSTTQLVELCEQALAAHTTGPGHTWRGDQVARVFRGIYCAQRAAYVMSYDDAEFDATPIEFPTTAPRRQLVPPPDLCSLYNDLRHLHYNTVDQHGQCWLPAGVEAQLSELIAATAALAAGFRRL